MSLEPSKHSRAVILYNPISGRGKGKQVANQAARYLEQNGVIVHAILATKSSSDTRRNLAAKYATEVDLIVVVGGDGTLRDTASGLIDVQGNASLGFIPLGNANVVARELGIPQSVDLAIHNLIHGQARSIDVGLFTSDTTRNEYFLAMIEIGRGATIVHQVQRLRMGALRRTYRYLGDLVYAIATLLSIKKTSTSFDIVDGHGNTIRDMHSAWICSMATYSKGWKICNTARCDDGLMDLCATKDPSFMHFISVMLHAALHRSQKLKQMARSRASFYEISSDDLLAIQADGDPLAACKSISIEVLPQAITLIAPKA